MEGGRSVEDDDARGSEGAGRLLGGRYRLGELLGRGGAAAVYEAVDLTLGRRVAVKLYQAAEPVGRYRFVSEARLLAGLSHPGLVTVFDVSLDDGQPFLVLRLVDGPTLREVMNTGPLGPEAVARIGASLAAALAYVHGKSVVHRDIKPSNVLVDPAGQPLLGDFGLARALGAVHLTVTGEYVGTPAYLAPEQITDVEVGPSVDIYALGLVLLECLTGQTEYTGTAAETALARLSRRPRIPRNLPSEWQSLLTAMTAQDPADRPSAKRCASLLTGLAEGRPAAVSAEPTIPQPRSALRRTRALRPGPVHAGVAALALAAAAAIAVMTADGTPDSPAGQPVVPAPGTSHAEPASPAPSAAPVPARTTDGTPAPLPGPVTTVAQQGAAPVTSSTGAPQSNGNASNANANTDSGSAGSGSAGNAGSGNAGSGNAGNGNAGNGNAGNGNAGNGDAGSGGAGSGNGKDNGKAKN